MFTDIVGYTALAEKNESLALELLEEHRKLLRPIFPKHNGKEIKTIGDAFLVEFGSALEAVTCALEIQRTMHENNNAVQARNRIALRIGVHLGDVTHTGGDVYGDAVNVASRLEPLAEPGGICVSDQVYVQVRNKLEYPFVKLGTRHLRNVQEPVEVYRIAPPWEKDRLSPQTIASDRDRMVVLPFKSLSPDPDDEYFADGLTEELITALSGIRELDVIARTTAMRYKDFTKGAQEIGRELNSNSMIEGSVRKAGNKVRIAVQLIDTRNESHLWVENYDRQLDDIFEVQSDIAKRVAEALKLRLTGEDAHAIESKPTSNMDAYALYLKGRYLWGKRDRESMIQAIGCYQRAVTMDPSFALGYSGLAECYVIMAFFGFGDRASSVEKAGANVTKALELNNRLAEAHTALGILYAIRDGNVRLGEEEFRRAIELNPSYVTAHQWLGTFLSYQGQFDEAYPEFRKALDLDPLSLKINADFGDFFQNRREYDKAIEQLKKVLQGDPNYMPAHAYLAIAYGRNGMLDQAIKEWEMVSEFIPGVAPSREMVLAYKYAMTGNVEEARKLVLTFKKQLSNLRQRPQDLLFVSAALFVLGEYDEGFEWLNRGAEEHNPFLLYIKVAPELDKVRSDPRYIALLKRVGLD